MSRAVARDAVEEANAALGAAISTCSLPSATESMLLEVQYELLDLADAVGSGGPVPELTRLGLAAREYRVVVSRSFAVLGGLSDAAGLLKLARGVARRAAREVADESTVAASSLELLGELLLAVAYRAEEAEHSPGVVGLCVD